MPTAVISDTVREPTVAEVKQFIMTGDFTQGSGIDVQVTVSILDDATGEEHQRLSFEGNFSVGQKNHFQSDVAAAMSDIVADVETILGVTFV